MRKLFILLIFIFCVSSCDNHQKLTSYLQPVKEFKLKVDDKINDINFLFIIDNSVSMGDFQETLAQNIKLFLEPIFLKFSYYNYSFAILTTTPPPKNNTSPVLFLLPNSSYKNKYENCDIKLPSSLFHSTNMGDYLNYSKENFQQLSSSDLVCVLANNIKAIGTGGSTSESYFQSLAYLIKNSDEKFRNQFFNKNKFLILFFISDNYSGVTYNNMLKQGIDNAADILAEERLKLLKNSSIGELKHIRSYAAVLDNRKGDKCGGDGGGGSPEKYPFHLYKFIEKTGGLRISICESNWGLRLVNVFDDLNEQLYINILYLDEVPELETMEVFLNGKKVPKDINKGWSFNPEQLSITIGFDFKYAPYLSENLKNEFTVKYNPINIELLREDIK